VRCKGERSEQLTADRPADPSQRLDTPHADMLWDQLKTERVTTR
jgi:hypothetical protein